jgi:hypothetical protein
MCEQAREQRERIEKLEAALKQIRDDYPGSSMAEFCQKTLDGKPL